MAAIKLGNDEDIADAAHTDLELIPGSHGTSTVQDAAEQQKLQKASRTAKALTGFMTICLLILWPMPMYGSGYIFSKKVGFKETSRHILLHGVADILSSFSPVGFP